MTSSPNFCTGSELIMSRCKREQMRDSALEKLITEDLARHHYSTNENSEGHGAICPQAWSWLATDAGLGSSPTSQSTAGILSRGSFRPQRRLRPPVLPSILSLPPGKKPRVYGMCPVRACRPPYPDHQAPGILEFQPNDLKPPPKAGAGSSLGQSKERVVYWCVA